MKKLVSTIALAATALLLSACYESTEVTRHEPGVYKGGDDAQTQAAGNRQDALRKRFELVQLDR